MSKLILGFGGEIASGKGTCAKYLKEHHGAVIYRFSSILRDVIKRLHLTEDRDTMQRISTALRAELGGDLLAKVMFEDAKEDSNQLIVIDGVRRLDDVKYLRELPEFKLCYIEAPIQTRYQRIILRGENADDATKTYEDFQKDHERESERQIPLLKEHAAHLIDNKGTLAQLHAQLDAIVASTK